MKSGKQRRVEILAKRKNRTVKRTVVVAAREKNQPPSRFISVNVALLAPNNSYGAPDFVRRGYYVDRPFRCVDCNKEEVWTGSQQKWWYEVAKGFAYSTAIRCGVCRRKERARPEEARRIHLEGLAGKKKVG